MSFVLFLAVLVVLIVVHELGHFLVAKWFGIRVEEFGIGYPPRAFTLGTWRDTTYTLNWLPFGGFVRIFGEQHDRPYAPAEKKQAFVHKPRIVQAAVLIAGVVFNLIFAWVLLSATFMLGAPTAIDESQAEGVETRLIVSSVIAGSPADAAGLLSGDQIVAIETTTSELEELVPSKASAYVQSRPGESVYVSYIRDLETQEVETLTLVPAHGVLDETPGKPAVGIAMALVADQSLPFFKSIYEGFKSTLGALVTVTVGLVVFFSSIATNSVDWSQIAGPVGIAGLVGDASSVGIVYLLYFTAFISVNLAVINLIPIPALDGGRLLFVGIEAIRKKPISEKITNVCNLVGFTLIIALMVFVTYHDIARIFAW